MAVNFSQKLIAPPELSAVMTGSFVTIGSLVENPTIIIFDNQGTAPVAISLDNGLTTWRTFPAGEALVLDVEVAGVSFSTGTTFYGNGASGTFSISYVYANDR